MIGGRIAKPRARSVCSVCTSTEAFRGFGRDCRRTVYCERGRSSSNRRSLVSTRLRAFTHGGAVVEIEAFRQQVRDFLEKEAPQSLKGLNDPKYAYWGGRKPELPHPDATRYCELAAARGLTAITWPTEYGGGGLT